MLRFDLHRVIAVGLCCALVLLAPCMVGASSEAIEPDEPTARPAAVDALNSSHSGVPGAAYSRLLAANARPASEVLIEVRGVGAAESAPTSEPWLRAAILPIRI